MTRVTILWAHWSGYMDACAQALVEEQGCEVTIGYLLPEGNAPFSQKDFFQYSCTAVPADAQLEPLPSAILESAPDILLVCGWHLPAYRRFSAAHKGRGVRVLCMDNQWHGTARQWLGVLSAPFFLRPAYDAALVPGARQAAFARRLGFPAARIREGHYACDYAPFSARHAARQSRPLTRNFLFAGRLVPQKGVDVLMEAWRRFTEQGHAHWNLTIVGGGTLPDGMTLPPRVRMTGFVQPSALPDTFLQGDIFVLPSNWEPWGLVIHEAAATGMPLICSQPCGAADAYLRDGVNGYLIPRNDPSSLLSAFEKFSRMNEEGLRQMGQASFDLAAKRTPSTWASTVIATLRDMK